MISGDANGLILYEGEWIFVANGVIQSQHTGLALYDGEWFYINKGKLDTTINRLVEYDGGLFVVAVGRIVREVNGLWQNPATACGITLQRARYRNSIPARHSMTVPGSTL